MTMWLDEETEEQAILVLAIDRFSQERVIRKLLALDQFLDRLERQTIGADGKQLCRDTRAVGITLLVWIREAIPPAGYLGTKEGD